MARGDPPVQTGLPADYNPGPSRFPRPVISFDTVTHESHYAGPKWKVVDVVPPSSSSGGAGTAAGEINKGAVEIEATSDIIAGANNLLPVVYGGPVKLGPLIVGIVGDVAGTATYLNMTGVLSHGPVGGIDSIVLDDKPGMEGATFEAMIGSPSQVALPSLVAAYAAHGITYADAMPGVAYVNIRLAAGMPLSNVPKVAVTMRGRTVLDMRTGTTGYSDNPTLCLADFIKSPVYGAGKDYDIPSFSACATWNDEYATGTAEPSRRIALALTNKQRVDEWITLLAVYANVDLYQIGGVYYASPRKAKASSFVFNNANIVRDSVAIERLPMRNVPTISTVKYTDTTVTPWSTRDCLPMMVPGVEDNSVPARDSTVSLPGITRETQAKREALERLNWNIYGNTAYAWTGYDDAAGVRKGDVVTFTHAIGITNRLIWINSVDDLGFGRYAFKGTGYDPLIFAGTPPISVSPIDSSVLIPGVTPPQVKNVLGAEELYQKQNGDWDSRVRFEWTSTGTDVSFDHFALAINDVTNSAAEFLADSRNTTLPSMVTYALQEGRKYRLYVMAVSVLGISGPMAQSNIVNVLGKLAKPGDVPGFTGTEAGGTVYLRWGRAIDIDVERYEIKRGAVGSAWDAKTMVAVADALATILPGQPEGAQEYSIKAIDSVGGYSVNPSTITIAVTVDSGSVSLSYTYNTYAPSNMQVVGNAYEHGRSNYALATNGGVAGASSEYQGTYLASYTNNGEVSNATTTGMWISNQNTLPTWIFITFPVARWIDTVVVYFLQDVTNTVTPPTDTTVSTIYAPTAFDILVMVNGAWQTVATITGNNLVKRTITFAPVLAQRVNLTVNALPAGANGFVRVVEVEAYGVPSAIYDTNVALPAFGSVALAQSEYTPGTYQATLVNNGNITGGGNQYWACANGAVLPQWCAVNFQRQRVINRVVVYGLQDGFATLPPTDTMTGTAYLPTAFDVQLYQAIGGWVTVASIVGNNLVKRTITFPAQVCGGVQIVVKASQHALALLVEIEAYSPQRDTSLPYYTINYTGLWADGADNPNNAVGTFDDSLKDNLIGFPTAAGASQLVTGVLDQGSVLNGRWSFAGTANIVDSLTGAPFNDALITRAIDYSTDNINFTAGVPDTVFAARYLRLRASCPTGYVMRALQDFTLNFSTTLREERGTATITDGVTGKITVTLTQKYARYVSIQLTVQSGGSGRFAVYDAVVVGASVTNKFDIVLFTSANVPTTGTVAWLFQGLN